LSEPALAARWRALGGAGRAALIPYLTAGFPSDAVSRDAIRSAVDAGADVIEVGVPFSDPLADGPTIQRASERALAGGMTMARALTLIEALALPVPVILMTYANPVLAYGIERFTKDARAAGVAGVLLTDTPAGIDPELEQAVLGARLDLIRLVAPTTSPARLAAVVRGAGGFVYLISRLGVTGARDELPPDLHAQVSRVRAVTPLPVAVGFGIGTPALARQTARLADGVVVGSAVVNALDQGGCAAVTALIGRLAAAVRDARA